MDEQQKKISLPEAIIMVMIVSGAYLLGVVAVFLVAIPVIGQIFLFSDWFINIIVLAIIQFWLIMKGGIGFKAQITALVGNLVELVPLLNIIPANILCLLLAIYLINHPKVMQAAGIAKKITGKKGKGENKGESENKDEIKNENQ